MLPYAPKRQSHAINIHVFWHEDKAAVSACSSEDGYHKQWVVSLWPAPLLSLGTQRILVYPPARQSTKRMR